MAMLITPERSHMIPDSEPYTSGVVEISVAASISTKLSVPPRAAQVRKAHTKTITPRVKMRYVPRLPPAHDEDGADQRADDGEHDRRRTHGHLQGGDVDRRGSREDERRLLMSRRAEAEGEEGHEGDHDEEQPHPPLAPELDDPRLRCGQIRGHEADCRHVAGPTRRRAPGAPGRRRAISSTPSW